MSIYNVQLYIYTTKLFCQRQRDWITSRADVAYSYMVQPDGLDRHCYNLKVGYKQDKLYIIVHLYLTNLWS